MMSSIGSAATPTSTRRSGISLSFTGVTVTSPSRSVRTGHSAAISWSSSAFGDPVEIRTGPPPQMKVLIVSFAFPPSNVIGAVRVGKLARYLDQRGHDVRVLATDIVDDRSLPLEISRERVLYTEYRQRQRWVDHMARLLRGHTAVHARVRA